MVVTRSSATTVGAAASCGCPRLTRQPIESIQIIGLGAHDVRLQYFPQFLGLVGIGQLDDGGMVGEGSRRLAFGTDGKMCPQGCDAPQNAVIGTGEIAITADAEKARWNSVSQRP